ncbi:MAG: hypothetical protein JNK84_10835 [Phreatobacter sp.]|uniref:hypothetical protein n=1 Tax=Phreatobacter sp. TaxID=1966341 RepID=UPI001A600199|nr:hypothetical protein [Phreatobacter sp.]MBL8569568.1 hypothetical protein [Phreatobacter sp.]
MKVFIFEGDGPVFGFTTVASGDNLPIERGPWVPVGQIEMQSGRVPRIGVSSDVVLAAIGRVGFYLQGTIAHERSFH